MPISSLSDLRKFVGSDWNDVSDADLIKSYADSIGADPADVAYNLRYDLTPGGKNANRMSSSVDRYQANLYGVGEEVAKGVGLDSAANWLGERRRTNELQADVATRRAREQGAIESWDEVNGLRDFGDYAVGLGIQSAPYLGESIVGGLGARVAMGGTRAALRGAEAAGDLAGAARAKRALDIGSSVGGVAASYPSSVGDILSNQREQSGTTDGVAAGVLGLGYAALNAVGLEGAAARSTAFRNPLNLLDNVGGIKGGVARMGATALKTGVVEGATETGQEVINQVGRMAVDPTATLDSDDALNRYKESFIGGAVLGGGTSAALGGWRRSSQSFIEGANTGTVDTNPTAPASDVGQVIQSQAPAVPTPPAAPITAPVVQGGTSDIAVANQQQQQQEVETQRALQEQARRETAFETIGAALTTDNGGTLTVFGKPVMGARIAPFGNELARQLEALPPHTQAIIKAIGEAHGVTGNKLVNFSFNANNPVGSAGQLLKTLNKVAEKFQINDAQNEQQAAEILNKLSETAKGAQLEQINAIYQALTGGDTAGYLASQVSQPKGASNGSVQQQVQQQNPAGLGTVREQGAAGEASSGDAGDVRPGGVQPVQSGSVPEGSLGLQTGQLPGEGIRAGSGDGSAVGGGVANQTSEVTNEQDQATAQSGGTQDVVGSTPVRGQGLQSTGTETSRPAARQEAEVTAGREAWNDMDASGVSYDQVPDNLKEAWERAVAEGKATGEVQEAIAKEAADLSAEAQAQKLVRRILDLVIVPTSRMKPEMAAKKREFVAAYFGGARLDKLTEVATSLGISKDQAKRWSAELPNFVEKYAEKLRAALDTAAAELDLTTEQVRDAMEALAGRQESQAVVAEEDTGQTTTAAEEPVESDNDARKEPNAEDEATDEGQVDERDTALIQRDRKSESIQEQFNATETNNAAILRTLEELEDAKEKGDDAKVDELQAKVDELIAQGTKQYEENKRRVRATAGKETKNAVQEQGAGEVDVRQEAGNGKKVGKRNAKPEKPAEQGVQTGAEQAAQAWDQVANEYPDAPKFADLTDEQRETFIEFGPENWTPDDVRTELTKLAKEQELSTPAKLKQESFSVKDDNFDPSDVEVDSRLRGKSISDALKWALDNARNEYERTVMRAVAARIAEMQKLGTVFSLKLTEPGRRLSSGASGVSMVTPAGLGQSMKVEIILNGAHAGDTSGANYETLAHELIHAATQAQLKFDKDGSAARQLKTLYDEVVKYYNERAKNGQLNEWEKKFWNQQNNSLTDPDELLAWGMTNEDFQLYLAGIEVTPRFTLWDKFVKLVASVLRVPVRANSALAQLMSVSENLLTEPLTPYVEEANRRFQSLGNQPNTTQWPSWSLNADHGAPVWRDGDYVLYKAQGDKGGTMFLPGMRRGDTSGVARVDVKDFSGTQIPADVVVKMRAAADSLRTKVNQMVKTQNLTNTLPDPVKKKADYVSTNLREAGRKGVLAAAITEDVVDMAKKYMESATDYLKAQYARQKTRLEFELRIERILSSFDKLNDATKKAVNEFIADSTKEGVWGYAPSYNPKVKIDDAMKSRFEAMPAAAQRVIQDTFDHGYQALQLKQKAVKDAANREFAERIKAANGNQQELNEIRLDKMAFENKFNRLLNIKNDKPYAYMGRYGDYVVVAKSAEYLEAEKLAREGDTAAAEWLTEHQADGDHYFVAFGETQGDVDQIKAELDASGMYDRTYAAQKIDKGAYTGGDDLFLAVTRLSRMLARKAKNDITGSLDGDSLKSLNKMIGDLYLATVAEASAHTASLQRKNVAGFDRDMMRNLATRGRADAHFLASLEHNEKITDTIEAMIDESENDPARARPYLNELLKRHANSMDYKTPSPLATTLTRMSNIWFLATSPAFYLQQILQTAVLSQPYLSGRLGYFRSMRAIKKAYADVAPLVKGLGLNDHVDFSKAPEDVRTMLNELVGMGKIDLGIDSDAKARAGDQGVLAKAMYKLQGVNTRIETINRAAAAIAAYRGYLDRYKNGDRAAATKFAAEVVSNTHGSYDGFNTPRLLSTDTGRVLFQFKRFQIIQLSMLMKLMSNAFKGASKEERAIARRALAFIGGHMAVLGGALGVPFVSQIAWAMSKLFGDPDEPDDFEFKLRRMIGDESMANLLLKGVPAFLGVDLSGKLAMQNVASVLPFNEGDISSRSGMEKTLVALMGPSAALSLKFADALGLMSKGDYYKGLEQALPSGMANALKGARFATEGVTMRNGDLVLPAEDVSLFDAAFQAVGLPTDTLTGRQRLQNYKAEFDDFYNTRTSELKQQYTKAAREGDSTTMAEAREEWKQLQESRARNGYTRQPLSTLLKAPNEAAKRGRNTVDGVQFNKQSVGFGRQFSNI